MNLRRVFDLAAETTMTQQAREAYWRMVFHLTGEVPECCD